LLLIVSGFGAYFIDKSSVQKSPLELREIMLKISEQIEKIIKEGKSPITFYQVSSVFWSYQHFFEDPKFYNFKEVMK
jgi:hypothetical protein